MKHLVKLGEGANVTPLLAALDEHPELWDEHPYRTGLKNGPFTQTSDLWVRFRDPADLRDPAKFAAPHFATWYPCCAKLPSLRSLMADVMALCSKAIWPKVIAHLGGVLITKMPPHTKILPHNDRGSWHAEFYNFKVYVPLKANEQCINRCAYESAIMRPGEVWSFDNLVEHSVENNGETERIILIACMRAE